MNDKEHPARTTAVGMDRKLTAILAADVKGYSRLMGEDEVGTLRTLTAYRKIIDTLIAQHHGRIVGTAGDSVLAEFASVVDAVQCAVVIQTTLRAENAPLPPDRKMEFRIGINLGDVMVEGEQIYGDGVNIAARLEALAEGGSICISDTVHDQIENKLSLHCEYLGEQTVKNIKKPVRVWRVIIEPEVAFTAGETESSESKVQSPKSKGENQNLRRVGIAHRKGAVVAVVGLLLLVGTIATIRYLFPIPSSQPLAPSTQPAPTLPLPDKPSIVVLPFVNMSEDPKQEYFSDGLTEDLTSDLSKISSLFVIARNSAFTYKGKEVKVQDVSKELGVRYVLEGSVRKADNQVRINAQLIDATTGGHLWSGRYDRPLHDIFALQNEIVQKIVTTLKLQLTLREQGFLTRFSTNNLEAYDYYLRGMEFWYRLTKETNLQARQMYEKAITLDPQYAEAYVGLGHTYWLEWVLEWGQNLQPLEQAFTLGQKAITFDDSQPWGHMLLGQVYVFRKQHEQAITEAQRAVALDPNYADSYLELGEMLTLAGRPEEAIEAMEKALHLNPHAPAFYFSNLGLFSFSAGRYEEGIAALKKAISRNPNNPYAHLHLAATYSQLGRGEEARAEAAEVLRINPTFSLEGWGRILPFKDQAVLERYLAALRKAGLK